MIGPLPPRHRMLVFLATLLGFLAGGLWLAQRMDLPLGGLGLGLSLGVVAAFVLLHDFDSHDPKPQRVRVRR